MKSRREFLKTAGLLAPGAMLASTSALASTDVFAASSKVEPPPTASVAERCEERRIRKTKNGKAQTFEDETVAPQNTSILCRTFCRLQYLNVEDKRIIRAYDFTGGQECRGVTRVINMDGVEDRFRVTKCAYYPGRGGNSSPHNVVLIMQSGQEHKDAARRLLGGYCGFPTAEDMRLEAEFKDKLKSFGIDIIYTEMYAFGSARNDAVAVNHFLEDKTEWTGKQWFEPCAWDALHYFADSDIKDMKEIIIPDVFAEADASFMLPHRCTYHPIGW